MKRHAIFFTRLREDAWSGALWLAERGIETIADHPDKKVADLLPHRYKSKLVGNGVLARALTLEYAYSKTRNDRDLRQIELWQNPSQQ